MFNQQKKDQTNVWVGGNVGEYRHTGKKFSPLKRTHGGGGHRAGGPPGSSTVGGGTRKEGGRVTGD